MTARPSPSPDTDALPTVPDPERGGVGDRGGVGRRGPLARALDSVSDPVLRILVTATLISRVGRGIFLTVTVLYFTLIVGLPAHEVAIVLAASSAAGVVASFAGGALADRVPPKRLLLLFTALEGLGLAGYAFAGDVVSALLVGIVVGGFGQAANSSRMAIIARAFVAESRVHARAVLRTVTNLAIAVGSGVGAIALALGTAEAYRTLLLLAALAYLLGLVRLVRLPASVATAGPAPEASEPVLTATGSTDAVATAREARRARAAHSPWRDPRYLALTALSAVFAMQFGVGELAVPLWIAHDTAAPDVLVSATLILNTLVVIAFQVPLSRGTHDLRRAGRVSALAGWLMAAACVVYAIAAGQPAWVAAVVIVSAALAHAFAEVLSQAGGWGLSFELADPVRAGTYQGVFSMGYSVGAMCAPLLVAATTDAHGAIGWLVLGALFLASAMGIWAIARGATGRAAA